MQDHSEAYATRILGLRQEPNGFESLALEIFRFQARQNATYHEFLQRIGCQPDSVKDILHIPFLPISLFKTRAIKTGNWHSDIQFRSSGTSQQTRSIHWVENLDWYHLISQTIFEDQVRSLADISILGLLPTYLENPQSSLIAMVQHFGAISQNPVLYCGLDFELFINQLESARKGGKPILLFSVTYALLKLATASDIDLSDCLTIETGGMKGLDEKLTKAETLEIIKNRLNIKHLYSEYGMTELLSQSYAEDLVYTPGFCKKVLVRALDEPLGPFKKDGRGAFQIIDLANYATCSFIATDDAGTLYPDGRFELLGRVESAEIRGCNLLFSQE